MQLHGQVRNGVIVLDEGSPRLPEGTRVDVVAESQQIPIEERSRLDFPLVRVPHTTIVKEPGKLPYVTGGLPGIWVLTNQMIADIQEEEDLEMLRRSGGLPS